MVLKTFISDISHDIIEVNYYNKTHNAIFNIKQIDHIAENIKIIDNIIEYLKINDIKWIIIDLKFRFNIPENTIWFKNKKTRLIHIHIEDFEKFYLQNLTNIVTKNNIFIPIEQEDNDTTNNNLWTTVIDKKKAKWQKMNELKKELTTISGDWNSL